ncbi:MAG: type II secretion system F family protein [Candidatus Eremiobacteraeota bacterium]|nr:type II secretion system F family protein [Candidatus Eremiobacteraeota bacterium]
MVGFFPLAIGAGVLGVIGLAFFALGGDVRAFLGKFGQTFQARIDRADMSIKAEEVALAVIGAGALGWVGLLLFMRPSVIFSAILLPVALGGAYFAGNFYLKFRGDRRVNGFSQQLEMVLRMLSGALRVGLGLRQAIILVTEEVPDPARREFMRVIGRTNIGISVLDALDELAKSMPSNEMIMFARAVRVQQQTGGDLARVLETLAATIRDRRRVFRKMSALTAQGRFGAFIIGAMPIGIGLFVLGTQPGMANALLHTTPGLICLATVGVLEGLAIFTLSRILQFDV